jgi:hypothetical protein
VTIETEVERVIFDSDDALTTDEETVSVAEAAQLLGRDRTRVDALLRSGDLVAAPRDPDDEGPVRIARASIERWLALAVRVTGEVGVEAVDIEADVVAALEQSGVVERPLVLKELVVHCPEVL